MILIVDAETEALVLELARRRNVAPAEAVRIAASALADRSEPDRARTPVAGPPGVAMDALDRQLETWRRARRAAR